jgi:apolipoprotein N-acyltransferase
VAAAIASTSRQVGATLGVAVLGALMTSHEHGSAHASLAAASHDGWWVMVACAVAVLALGILSSTSWATRTAERTAERVAAA